MFVCGLAVFAAGAVGQWGIGRVLDTATRAATDEGPLAVDAGGAQDDWVIVPTDSTSALPKAPEPGRSQLTRAARGVGGAPVDPSYLFDTYGLVDTPVIIRGISAHDVTCERAAGDWTGARIAGGGAFDELPVQIELSANAETADGVPEVVPTGDEAGIWTFPRQVSGSEADRFLVTLRAPAKSICSLRLRVDYISRGEAGTLVVEDNGRRFQAAAEDIVEPTIEW